MRALVDELLALPGVALDWRVPDAPSTSPVIPIGFMVDGVVSNWFSMVTTVGTPQTVAAQEMRVECMFPADQAPHGPFRSEV